MSKTPRVAVIQPRLDGHGGLEKYGVYVIQALANRMPVDVLLEHEVDPAAVERAFGVKLDTPRFICDPRISPNPPHGGSLQDRLARRKAIADYQQVTAQYDLIVGQSIGLPYLSGAKRSVLLCHFPVVRNQRIDESVPRQGLKAMLSSRGREQKEIWDRLSSWTRVIANSAFTRRWVKTYWARDAEIINPPIATAPSPELNGKRNWILGIGFFSRPQGGEQWSYKRQELLIDNFKALCDAGLKGWELHLAGHVLPPTPETHAYVEELRARAENYPVTLHPSCPYAELLDLYRHASIFWHATGYGLDEETQPERMEHFGMVTAEAMSWGCVPVAINNGGQPEIVEHGRSGYLWSSQEQLREQTLSLVRDACTRGELAEAAILRSHKFGLERFRKQLDTLVDEELSHLRAVAR